MRMRLPIVEAAGAFAPRDGNRKPGNSECRAALRQPADVKLTEVRTLPRQSVLNVISGTSHLPFVKTHLS